MLFNSVVRLLAITLVTSSTSVSAAPIGFAADASTSSASPDISSLGSGDSSEFTDSSSDDDLDLSGFSSSDSDFDFSSIAYNSDGSRTELSEFGGFASVSASELGPKHSGFGNGHFGGMPSQVSFGGNTATSLDFASYPSGSGDYGSEQSGDDSGESASSVYLDEDVSSITVDDESSETIMTVADTDNEKLIKRSHESTSISTSGNAAVTSYSSIYFDKSKKSSDDDDDSDDDNDDDDDDDDDDNHSSSASSGGDDDDSSSTKTSSHSTKKSTKTKSGSDSTSTKKSTKTSSSSDSTSTKGSSSSEDDDDDSSSTASSSGTSSSEGSSSSDDDNESSDSGDSSSSSSSSSSGDSSSDESGDSSSSSGSSSDESGDSSSSSGSKTSSGSSSTSLSSTGSSNSGSSSGSSSSSSGSAFGYASLNGGTTGGEGGEEVTATTLDELTQYAAQEGSLIITVSGSFTGTDSISVSSDKTIIGASGASLEGVGFSIKSVSNVVIRNLAISKVVGGDAVGIQKSTNVWIDHLELSSDMDNGKDYYDGLVDVTHACDYITVSNCYFHDHYKVSLVGHSDSNSDEDTGHLTVTYAYNYFDNVSSRGPSFRFGTGHMYNNYYNDMDDCINIREGATALVENNVFSGVSKALYSVDGTGSAQSSGNDFGDGSNDINSATVSMSYSYTLKDASEVASYVQGNAGAVL